MVGKKLGTTLGTVVKFTRAEVLLPSVGCCDGEAVSLAAPDDGGDSVVGVGVRMKGADVE